MKIIDINDIIPPGWESGKFQGFEHGAGVSFFVVHVSTGNGPDKHRHPYEETFVILDGMIEFIVAGETHMIEGGKTAIVPANTWHEFKNRSERPALTVNIHPVPKIIQEDWVDNKK